MFGTPSNHPFLSMIKYPSIKFDYEKVFRLVRENTRKKIDKRKLKFDQKIKTVEYRKGDRVLAKTYQLSDKLGKKNKKYFLLYEGPYEVKKMGNAYVLIDVLSGTIKGTYNVRQKKKFIE